MSDLNKLILKAITVAAERTGDVDTEDGTYATTDVDEMIRLESSIESVFEMESYDLIRTGSVDARIQIAINNQLASQISNNTKESHLRIKELEATLLTVRSERDIERARADSLEAQLDKAMGNY